MHAYLFKAIKFGGIICYIAVANIQFFSPIALCICVCVCVCVCVCGCVCVVWYVCVCAEKGLSGRKKGLV